MLFCEDPKVRQRVICGVRDTGARRFCLEKTFQNFFGDDLMSLGARRLSVCFVVVVVVAILRDW